MWLLTIVFVETFEESSHSVVPQLNRAIVKSSEDPRTLWVESDTLDAVALGLELVAQIDEGGGKNRSR
jgi:hypothetical protein